MSIPVGSDLSFVGGARISGLPPATVEGQPVTLSQLGGQGGGNQINNIILDFGNVPIGSKVFTFPHGGATVNQNILMSSSANMPNNMSADELEMDSFNVSAYVATPGSIVAVIVANPGPVIGERRFTYQLG